MSHWCKGAQCLHSKCRRVRARGAVATVPAAVALPLFYRDQNQGVPSSYSVTRAQANAMRDAGRGRFINRGLAFQLDELSPERPRFTPSQSGESDTSISMAEMEANVGIAGDLKDWQEESPAPRHVVDRAQKKIRAIGRRDEGTFDEKAPLAFGSWGGVYPADADAVVKV
jgi:hypothetical protein